MEVQIPLCQNAVVEFNMSKLVIILPKLWKANSIASVIAIAYTVLPSIIPSVLAAALSTSLCSALPSIAAETQQVRAITFPEDRSYGTIIKLEPNWNIFVRHPKGSFFAEARGKVQYSAKDALMLSARFPLTDNPAVMKKLPADSFQYITFLNLPAEDKIFEPLTHLTGLRRIDFQEGEFQDKAFAELAKLVNLEAISVRECFVTGDSLTHFGVLKKLRAMVWKKVALDWKLLNQSSTVFPAMADLQFSDTNLDDEGMIWLEKMPNLRQLSIDGSARVTDKGLLILKKLKKLKKLELKKMKAVTPKGIMQLKGGSLEAIHVGDANYTQLEIKQIKDAMPKVQFLFDKKKMKEGTMEIFAPLH